MAGQGIVRSFRHMDGFGVHTFRMVTNDGKSKLVKFHFKTLQGKAALVWEEAQALAGKNADFHREDLFESINAGYFPEWEFGVQIMNEEDQLKFGFDLLDPTKIVPEELVPITKLGKLTLNRNPTNYFAETEQVMFQPGHIVRGIDFSDDPLLQGRIFSYLDTQINRHGNPNFEQLPINQPRVPVHNNNRDGAGQMFIHANQAAYTPNTLNGGSPKQATQQEGRGFFTAPGRSASGPLVRNVGPTFNKDFWSQPRLFFNSLVPQEQQFLINAIRFETSHLKSIQVKKNILVQLNKISNEISTQVARVLGLPAPAPDSQFYHDRRTVGASQYEKPLLSLKGLKVGLLATSQTANSANAVKRSLANEGVKLVVVAELLAPGVDMTYSSADAVNFDGVIVAMGSQQIFSNNASASSLYPTGRPQQILLDAYRYGKPVGFMGGNQAQDDARIPAGPGVYVEGIQGAAVAKSKRGYGNSTTTEGMGEGGATSDMAQSFKDGLKQFKFLNRFPVERKLVV